MIHASHTRARARASVLLAISLVAQACGGANTPPAEGSPGPAGSADAAGTRQAESFAQPVGPSVGGEAAALPKKIALDLTRFYATGSAAWVAGAGRPTPAAGTALDLLHRATAHGLDPEDYGASELRAASAALEAAPAADAAARFDVRLTSGLLRFLHDVHIGRVDPATLGLQLVVPAERHDVGGMLRAAMDGGGLATLDAEFAPHVTQYRLLQGALEKYRALARANPAPAAAPAVTDGSMPTQEEVTHVLRLFGDLETTGEVSTIDDGAFRHALERFQARHGLTVDGELGPATTRALRVPLATRIRQIELALERLRWLPDLEDRRVIAINIPMFRLFAWDRAPHEGTPALSMRVIVGRALDTRTPVFTGDLSYLVFRPYWNVPTSILRGELLPAIEANSSYLERERLEIVAGQSDTSPVIAPAAESLALLRSGQARLRQRPGPTNALGLLKFMFPNRNDVYMHGTPAQALFGRTRRDFSHGCIRVEDPAALAAWVLGPDARWTREAIANAMNGANNQRVNVPDPVHVMILYITAAVDPADGSVNFAEDLYLLDPKLDKALSR